jgi:hypothetical protein
VLVLVLDIEVNATLLDIRVRVMDRYCKVKDFKRHMARCEFDRDARGNNRDEIIQTDPNSLLARRKSGSLYDLISVIAYCASNL